MAPVDVLVTSIHVTSAVAPDVARCGVPSTGAVASVRLVPNAPPVGANATLML